MIDPTAIHRIITHANCPDGIASAMLCHDAIPHATVEFVQYGEPSREQLEATDGMLFVDMTPPEARAQEFIDAGAWVLDHHRGAKELVGRFSERGVFADEAERPGIAGANLAYEHVWVPRFSHIWITQHFTELAGIRDTWRTDDPRWHDACAQAAVLTFFDAEHWLTGHPCHLTNDEWSVGFRLMERRAEAVERAAEKAMRFRIDPGFFGDDNGADGIDCAVFPDPDRLTSDVAERLRDDGIQVAAGFWFRDPGHLSVSLRSDGSVDVAQLAKRHGGGGHTRAAGFGWSLESGDVQPFELVRRLLCKGI